MIQGANTTSTNDREGPRKKGPVMCDALTRSVMDDCRVVVREDCFSGEVVTRSVSKNGIILVFIWGGKMSQRLAANVRLGQ